MFRKCLECLRLHAVSVPGECVLVLTNICLNRFNDYGEDGGPAAKELASKLGEIKELIFTKVGVKLPDIEVRNSPLCIRLERLGWVNFPPWRYSRNFLNLPMEV